jgi:ABC-type bacteriocin/lantibiotic exporter with double-glycine peptidase domain
LLLILNVKVTTSTLEKDLYNHPDYPSLLSINDVLIGYGVGNICIKSSVDKLSEIPVPFIAPISSESSDNLFVVIESVNGNTIRYYDPEKHQWENISKENFEKKWPSGIILLTDAEDAVGEKDYITKFREEKRLNVAKYATPG